MNFRHLLAAKSRERREAGPIEDQIVAHASRVAARAEGGDEVTNGAEFRGGGGLLVFLVTLYGFASLVADVWGWMQ